jgi:hypothetical protein
MLWGYVFIHVHSIFSEDLLIRPFNPSRSVRTYGWLPAFPEMHKIIFDEETQTLYEICLKPRVN